MGNYADLPPTIPDYQPSAEVAHKMDPTDHKINNDALSEISTELALCAQYKKDIIKFRITMSAPGLIMNLQEKQYIMINAVYVEQETFINIIDTVNKYLNAKYFPAKLSIKKLEYHSRAHGDYQQSIMCIDKTDLCNTGLGFIFALNADAYSNLASQQITCEYMIQLSSDNPLHCPIYHAMKEDHEYKQENLNHLDSFVHFVDEFGEKPKCHDIDGDCKSYKNLENGGNELVDRCHLKLFRHPPRTKHIQISKNTKSFLSVDVEKNPPQLYQVSKQDKTQYDFNETDGFLHALLQEVLQNGYKIDLCGYPSYMHIDDDDVDAPEECKHDVKNNLINDPDKTLLKVIDEKMQHIRHKKMLNPLNRAQMLALILYTGCDCFDNLCSAQRKGDYAKWKWFDYCLFYAITSLSDCEIGHFTAFSGLHDVKLPTNEVKGKFLTTYTSFSWKKEVAEGFMMDKGMMIHINVQQEPQTQSYKKTMKCCDVSWISRFPDECEILLSRQINGHSPCKFTIIDDANDIQTVLLEPEPWDPEAYFRRTFAGCNRIDYGIATGAETGVFKVTGHKTQHENATQCENNEENTNTDNSIKNKE